MLVNKDYDDYIVFLLGTDEFDVCNKIKKWAKNNYDMYGAYEMCVEIAKKFEKYDRQYPDCSQYDNFECFLDEYNKELIDFIENDINFEVREDEKN